MGVFGAAGRTGAGQCEGVRWWAGNAREEAVQPEGFRWPACWCICCAVFAGFQLISSLMPALPPEFTLPAAGDSRGSTRASLSSVLCAIRVRQCPHGQQQQMWKDPRDIGCSDMTRSPRRSCSPLTQGSTDQCFLQPCACLCGCLAVGCLHQADVFHEVPAAGRGVPCARQWGAYVKQRCSMCQAVVYL